MTTVKKIARHKVRNIEPELMVSLTSVVKGMTHSDLLPLSAYLCMTGQTLTAKNLRGRRGKKLALGYLASLYSRRLLGPQSHASSYLRSRRFKRSVESLGCSIEISLSSLKVPDGLRDAVNEFEEASLIEEEVWRWSGWPIASQEGIPHYLHLDPVFEIMGREFTEHLHAALNSYKRARRGATLGSVPDFVAFIEALGQTTSHAAWKVQENVDRYIREFGEFYFRRADDKELLLNSKAKTWNLEVAYLFEALAQKGAIAKPSIEVPFISLGPSDVTRGSTVLVDSLVLTMPPGLKDHQLKEHMYKRLSESIDMITSWADKECRILWTRKVSAEALAKTGAPRQFKEDGVNGRTLVQDESWDANCCATYARYGHALHRYEGSASKHIKHVYGRDVDVVLQTACIPTRGELLPYAILIVAAHPSITTSMLEKVEVYDTPQSVAVLRGESNSRYILLYKNRKGPDKAETRVVLTQRTAELLNQVLALTEPLRNYLRARNDPAWKKLFLTTSGAMTKPLVENFSASCTRMEEAGKLRQRIRKTMGLSASKVKTLTENLTLRSLRATVATLIYLKTGSTESMSVALGHSSHNTQLIDKYLPKQIRVMVEEYWIRSFQMALMAHAIKNSSSLKVALVGADPSALMQTARFDFIDKLKRRRITPTMEKDRESKLVVEVSETSLTEMIVFNERLARTESATSDEMLLASFVRTLVRLIDQTTNRPDWTSMLSRSRHKASQHVIEALQ